MIHRFFFSAKSSLLQTQYTVNRRRRRRENMILFNIMIRSERAKKTKMCNVHIVINEMFLKMSRNSVLKIHNMRLTRVHCVTRKSVTLLLSLLFFPFLFFKEKHILKCAIPTISCFAVDFISIIIVIIVIIITIHHYHCDVCVYIYL